MTARRRRKVLTISGIGRPKKEKTITASFLGDQLPDLFFLFLFNYWTAQFLLFFIDRSSIKKNKRKGNVGQWTVYGFQPPLCG